MKILQINSVINIGSTGRITRDLYDYFEERGHDCVIAFGRGEATPGYKTIRIGSKIDQMSHLVYSRLTDRHGFASRTATRKFIQEIEAYDPDLIQLHNIHGYYLNVEVLFDYLAQKDIPVVWLLHDQWTVSGHGAYFDLNGDGTFPTKLLNRRELKNYPRTVGISQFEKNLEDKERLFTSIDKMTIVTPSNWLTAMMKQTFLNKYEIKTIYNGLDTDVFYVDGSGREELRQRWKAEGKIVILGLASVWEERKGLEDFIKLSKLLPRNDCQIVLVGVDQETKEGLPNTIISINRTNSVDELRDIYNASDLFVNPTYFDNFPTVNIEALACGTPVITYDTGGSPEAVDEKTGSVVEQGDIRSLIHEIDLWSSKTSEVSKTCSDRVRNNFTKELTYEQYENLYTDLLKGGNPGAFH